MKFLDRLGVDRSSFTDLFSACLGCGARMQEAGSKLIVKGRRWSVDLSAVRSVSAMMRRALFGISVEKRAAAARGCGGMRTYINRLDERLLALARDVRDFGLRNGLAELSMPKLALSEEINGHALSAIACGLSQEPTIYYRCLHASGAVFVAFAAGECVAPDVRSSPVWTQASSSLWRAIT